MRILFLSSYLLFAESRSGAAKRLYYLARELARRHEVWLVSDDAGREAAAFQPAGSPGQRLLRLEYRRTGLAKLGDPFEVPAFLDAATLAQLEDFVAEARPDVVFCAFGLGLSLTGLPFLRSRFPVVYLEDDLALEVFRERSRTGPTLLRRWHQRIRLWQAEAFYGRHLPRVRSFIAISAEEAAIMRRLYPHLALTLVGYGIPLEDYPILPTADPHLSLGFIGNYIHHSNTDAVRHFLAEWYPPLRERFPGVRVHLAGKNLPPELSAPWRGDPGLVFAENIPVLRDFYAALSIFVNPIVSQRGLRTKLVEAAAFGRPIISTTLGAEGLDDLPLERADSPAEFLCAVERLQSPSAQATLASAARRAVELQYSIEAITAPLERCLQETADSAS